MKTTILLLFLMSSFLLWAQSTKEVDSKISQVTVYLQSAQVTRQIQTNLAKGKNELVVNGLSAKLDAQSLRVNASMGTTILSVNHFIDYLDQQKTDHQIQGLVNWRDELNDSISLLKNHLMVYNQEKEMVLANKNIGGTEKGLDVNQLKMAASFFRTRLMEIEALTHQGKRQLKEKQERLTALSRQLNQLNARKTRPTSSVRIMLQSNSAMNTSLEVNYMVREARWQPLYDIRVSDTDRPLSLVYKARVAQNSDEDWNNVALTISTGNPQLSNHKPEMAPWFMGFVPPPPPAISKLKTARATAELDEVLFADDESLTATPGLGEEYLNIVQQQTSTSYKIAIPYTIPADNQGYDVALVEHQLPVEYRYDAVPKLSPHVYLMALLENDLPQGLSPGKANLYYGQSYQGETWFNPFTTRDTLMVSVGREPGIVTKREILKDLTSKSFFGATNRETKAWEITVRNTKNSPALVLLEDQYPISQHEDIKVTLEEHSGAEIDKKRGILTWNLNLKPGETREVKFVYTVKYPRDKEVMLD